MSVLSTLRAEWASWWSLSYRDNAAQPLWAGVAVTVLFGTAIAGVRRAQEQVVREPRRVAARAEGEPVGVEHRPV